ncbi:putative transcriptional regulator (plasmid) [Sinorhizobium fredii NGR234]|uniref:Transcriptional regulator n=2 Tax=Rhizobium fredii TaxID=380 RepID=C3KN13_SINFN|nr:putative transcriptional regulator [Sinorhizobium fredii NGR234]
MNLRSDSAAARRQPRARKNHKAEPASPGGNKRPAGLNRSVSRALDLLLDIAHNPYPQSFVDLQHQHRVPKATLHKLLFTLEALHFIRRDQETGKYSVGLAALEVAAAGAASPADLPFLLKPILEKLVEENNETCHLGILQGGEEIILKRLDPLEQVVRLALTVGRRHPAYASSGGLASMALSMTDADLEAFPEALPQLTENTIKSREELRERLAEVRAKGYSLDMEEAYIGVRCVGVAVAVPNWPVVHISFSLPLQRAPVERLRALAKPLLAAAKEIEKILSVTPRA